MAGGAALGAGARTVASYDGVELAVYEAGDAAAPTIVLLHGYPDTHAVWKDVAARLVSRFHVVTYDVRGAGASGRPGGLAAYDFDRLVDDALAVAAAVSPHRPVHLVGHDWGSVQGWEVITLGRTQGRFASFTSLSGPSIDHVAHWLRDRLRQPSARGLRAVACQGAKSWYIGVLSMPGLGPLAWRTVLGRAFPTILRRREAVTAHPEHPAPTLPSDGAIGTRLYRRNFPRRLRRPRRDAVAHVPVQLVVATADRYVSPALLEDLDRWTPDLRRHALAAGHWAPLTHPDPLPTLIGGFVDEVETAPYRSA